MYHIMSRSTLTFGILLIWSFFMYFTLIYTMFTVLWLVAGADWSVLIWCEKKTLLAGYSEQSASINLEKG